MDVDRMRVVLLTGLAVVGFCMGTGAAALSDWGEQVAVWLRSEGKGQVFCETLPTAALLGNGDLGLVNGDLLSSDGTPVGKRFQLTKGDFFNGGCEGDFGKHERATQQIAFGALQFDFGRAFATDDTLSTRCGDLVSAAESAKIRVWVSATENLVVTEISGAPAPSVTYAFEDRDTHPHGSGRDENGDVWGWRKSFAVSPRVPCYCEAVSRKVVDASKNVTYVVTAVRTGKSLEAADPRRSLDSWATLPRIAELRGRHEAWWKDWWSRSEVHLPDATVQRYYEGALYLLGAGMRPDGNCGLYGSWVTTDNPSWHNDLHLNYNMQGTFYGVHTANRCEVAQAMVGPMLRTIPMGERNARERLREINPGYVDSRPELKCGIADAILLPVGVLPDGTSSEGETVFWNQVINAPMTAAMFCTYWEYTLDEDYWKRVYPFVSKTANFFLKWSEKRTLPDGTRRYSIMGCSWEGGGWGRNGTVASGCVRQIVSTLAERETDPQKKAKWTDFRDHLDPIGHERYRANGFDREIVSFMENGDWKPTAGNAVELEHIIPGEAFAFDLRPEDRTVVLNSIDAMFTVGTPEQVWGGINQTPKLFATAVRAGYPPRKVIEAFKRYQLNRHGQKNFTIHDGYHGIEKVGGIEFVNSMLLQSDHGYVKVFPNWTGEDVSFRDLRAKGAFLVSARMENGQVRALSIRSEKGGRLHLVNPLPDTQTAWPKGRTRYSGEETLEIDFRPGETIVLK